MKIYADNTKIRDEYGRQRIFRGENICFKSPYYTAKSVKACLNNLFEYLLAAGDNILRLGVTWAWIEPKEGKYNQAIIDVLHDFVKKCEKHNIEIMLDMHQDLFSYKFFGDGMPSWVIDKGIKPKRYLAIWAEGYFYMDCVQQAFNDFWQNKDNVQEKFVKMWQYFASQFDDCKNIIGYDFLNEPFITDNGRNVFCTLVERVIKTNYNIDIDARSYFEKDGNHQAFIKLVSKLTAIISQNGGPKKLLAATDNYDQFKSIINGLDIFTKDFNQKYYQPFIDKLNDAVSQNGICFFEHNYYSNLGVEFEINTKKNYIYSPHAYDLFVDSPLYNNYSSNNRIKFITDMISQNQQAMNVPVIFGEWGCGANGTKWIDHIEYVMDIMEEHQWSNIYWAYRRQNKEFCHRINRPYPMAICGDIISYKTDSKSRSFTLEFIQAKELENMDNEIYIPRKGVYSFKAKAGRHKVTLKY